MAQTLEEMQQGAFAEQIIPGFESMVRPSNVPSGAQLAPGLTQEQTDAAQLFRSGIGSYQPFLTAGSQALAASMGATGPGAATAYMNPYLQQVADTTMTDLNRQFGVQQQQSAAQQIASGGMRGAATRGAVMDAELARSQGDVSAKALAGLYAGGYQSALDASQRAAQTQAGIGQIYGQVMAPGAQQGLMGDVGKLFDIGEAQRQILGAQNLAEYQTPFYGLGQFANVLGQMPTPQQYQSPNPILTGIAAAGSIGNLFGG